MKARRLGAGVVGALIVAYWGLAFLGAIGNGSWMLVGLLSLALVYVAFERRARNHRPATVPADRHERG